MEATDQARRARVIAVLVAFAAVGGAAGTLHVPVHAGADSSDSLIRRVVAQTTRTGITVRATRELRAGTLSGNHHGWMTVETMVTPAGVFTWKVLAEGGSSRTRAKVFRAVLETEADSWRGGERDAAALTPDNYEFAALPVSSTGEIQFRLTPRRRDSRLIDGLLTVSSEGYPLRLEGKLAKSPSFWVKSVTVHKRYGRFAGVALPVSLESQADLKVFGKSTFSMRYQYREVNGRALNGATTIADLRR